MNSKLEKGKHYYETNGKIIFTALYHIERGVCCGNKCFNCPFYPPYIKGNLVLAKSFLKFKP